MTMETRTQELTDRKLLLMLRCRTNEEERRLENERQYTVFLSDLRLQSSSQSST